MIFQIPLVLNWPNEATFEHFYAQKTEGWLAYLQEVLKNNTESLIYLHGKQGVGLTHLLYAACHCMQQHQKTAIYLPLQKFALSNTLLEGMESLDLVCLDDIETIAGSLEQEEALFYCYHRAQASGTCLLIAAHAPPTHIKWALPDLASRLAAGVSFTVPLLSDSEKIQVLQKHAKRSDLYLSDRVAQYLLDHYSRDMADLLKMFKTLDHFSLSAQRHLTIPLVKQVLFKKNT